MKRFSTLFLLLSVIIPCFAVKSQHPPKIKGAFGIKLGSVFNKRNVGRIVKLNTGEMAYQIRVKQPTRKFSVYCVFLTPKTHKIYMLWACAYFNNKEAEREFLVIKNMLRKKYQKEIQEETIFMGGKCGWKVGNCAIYLKYENDLMEKSSLELVYVDLKLQKQAEKEHIQIESSKTDDSAF